MTTASNMKMIRYRVLKTSFELNEAFNPVKDEIGIEPNFSRLITKQNNSNFIIKLGVSISKEKHSEPIPFSAEVVIEGTFVFPKWDEQDARVIVTGNATAILFPYLRSILTNITCCGEVPAYVLPIVNVHRLFDENPNE